MSIWLVDIDGTLALHGSRGPYDWSRVAEDEPNAPVVEIVNALLADGHQICLLTGRMEQCRGATRRWLRAHLGQAAATSALYMRPDDDYRPDHVLKREIYQSTIKPLGPIAGVIDDRTRVVQMWRSLGLTCIQVAPGDF